MVRSGKATAGGGGATTRAMRRRHAEQWLIDLASNAELTPLFQALDLGSLTALACVAKAWQGAIELFRAAEPRLGQSTCCRWSSFGNPFASLFVERVLPRYVNLQHLNTNDFRYDLAETVLGMVSKWPRLRSLKMGFSRVKMADVVDLCRGLPLLRELTLDDPSAMADAHLESLLGCPQLRRLIFSRRVDPRPASFEGGGTVKPAPLVRALTEVANGPGCPLLEQLYLQGCKHLEHAMLSAAECCPGLRVLDLTGCRRVTDESIVAIGRACPRLEALHLRDCRLVSAGGVTAVASGCQHLKELNLHDCKRVTSDSIEAVARGCLQLECLTLRGCKEVGDPAFCALAHGCRRLQEIDAMDTKISAAGLTALLGNPLLTQLNILASDRLSQEAIDAARVSYPSLAEDPSAGRCWAGMLESPHIDLKMVTQDGNEYYFKCRRTMKMRKLMQAFCNRMGAPEMLGALRFLFDGNRLNETWTSLDLEMENGDVIDVMVEQVALPWSSLPVAKPITAAEQLLSDAAGAPSLSHSEVAALVAAAAGPHAKPGRAEVVETRPLLTAAQCAVLVDHAERAFAASAGVSDGESSWKLELSCEELAALAGPAAVDALYDYLGCSKPPHPKT